MSNLSDSAYGEDYESSSPVAVQKMHKIKKSSSLSVSASSQYSAKITASDSSASIKHSKSSGKLERKVSFSEADPVKIGENMLPSKPKRQKDKKKSEESAKNGPKAPKVSCNAAEFVDQVSAKLRALEQQQQNIEIISSPDSLDISATIKLSPKLAPSRPKSQANNPAITAILHDLVGPAENQIAPPAVAARQNSSALSRLGSKRNSLDKQSVQTLAQDLAAECAKAYALMESSLSKLSSDLGVTPFGLAPKNKVNYLFYDRPFLG